MKPDDEPTKSGFCRPCSQFDNRLPRYGNLIPVNDIALPCKLNLKPLGRIHFPQNGSAFPDNDNWNPANGNHVPHNGNGFPC